MTAPSVPDFAAHYDVIVIGGGAGGASAAVGAARSGARVLLIDRYGFLGGAATNAQVLSYCGFFTAHPEPVTTIGGVGADLLAHLRTLGFETGPVRSKSGNWIIMIDSEAVKLGFDRLISSSGVALALHTQLVSAATENGLIRSITVADHRGLHTLSANAFVDASGEASLAAFSGVAMSQPGGPGAHLQPASLPVRIGGVPPAASFDRTLMTSLVERYNETAEMPIPRADGGVLVRLPRSQDIWWMTIDLNTDGISGPDLARAETLAREQAWRFIEVLRQHPGFENAYLIATGPQIGIRETRRPRSLHDVTEADGHSGRRDSTGIARASWPMEVHVAPGKSRFMPIGGEGFFDVPHDALCVAEYRNLRLAGRVIGSDAEAYGSVRVMGTAFATGHAAGVSAALFAQHGHSEVSAVQAQLRTQNAII